MALPLPALLAASLLLAPGADTRPPAPAPGAETSWKLVMGSVRLPDAPRSAAAPLASRWSLEGLDWNPSFLLGASALYLRDGDDIIRMDLDTARKAWSVTQKGAFLREVPGALFLVTQDFRILCLDPATGAQRWEAQLGKEGGAEFHKGNLSILQSAFKGPVLAGDRVLVGTFGGSLFKGTTGSLYALDLATGKTLWTVAAEDGVENLPVVAGDKVYFGGKAACYKVDLATGEQLWKASTRNDNQWSFKVVDGSVLVSSGHYGSKGSSFGGTLYALDAGNGAVRWKFDIGGPSVVREENGLLVALEWGMMGGSRLSCVKLATGEKAWELKEKSSANPVLLAGRAVHINKDNQVFVVDAATGKVAGSFKAAGDFGMGFFKGPWGRFMDPGVLEGQAVVGSWDKARGETVLQALDLDKGAPAGELRFKGELETLQLNPTHCLVLVKGADAKYSLKVMSR
ncbi:PQQ-binding-like beta-propeller repeat protein [Geothrix sp. 21YS21S-2]|uniref:PQQ-binding-like beta-propeller repeat protein n=1 Tax=Geothrix sp. 21YS21S-2 TaxID=3068893 RepID=UPI0027B94389|nr:PQQ-binding-like beta-propeller repeat protein [Geothrix sp. 21YS21S-2]